jgi:hypothetical protein
MLLATALLSIALAPLRTILPPGIPGKPDFDPVTLAIFAAGTICNFLVTMPCIWGAMRPASKLIPLGLGWLLYCGLLTAVEFGALCALLGPPGGGDKTLDVGSFFYILNVSQCATVFGALLVLRMLGFQLVRRSPADRSGSPAAVPVVSPEGEPAAANSESQESP